MRLRYAFDTEEEDQTITAEGDVVDGQTTITITDHEAGLECDVLLHVDAIRALAKSLGIIADVLDPPEPSPAIRLDTMVKLGGYGSPTIYNNYNDGVQ